MRYKWKGVISFGVCQCSQLGPFVLRDDMRAQSSFQADMRSAILDLLAEEVHKSTDD